MFSWTAVLARKPGVPFISPSWEKSRPVKPRMPKPRRSQEKGRRQDSRSEGNIATLLPRVRPFARALIEKAANQGIIIKVTSGTRSFAEQDELFAQGRTKPGKRVSNARGGFSNHNFGLAFDVTIFKGSTDPEKAKTPVFESPIYKAIGALGTELGLEWGGNWKTIVDEPHFQLRPGWAVDLSEKEMLADLRERKDSGKDFFARRLGQSQVSRRQVHRNRLGRRG